MPRLFVTLALLILVGVVSPVSSVSAQDDPTMALLARLPGLESAYARKYMDASEFGVGTPATTGVDDVIVTLLGFRNEADARDAFKLTSGTLVAGAILGESDQPLTSTPVKGLGDDATLYLGGKTYLGGDERAEGLLLVRSGALGIVASGEGRNASQLSDMLRSFAAFIVDQKPSSTPVTVLGTGRATGGPFDLMPGPGDTSVLAGLVPVDDYDLLVNDSPIKPAATPSGQAPSPGGLRIRVAGTGASVR